MTQNFSHLCSELLTILEFGQKVREKVMLSYWEVEPIKTPNYQPTGTDFYSKETISLTLPTYNQLYGKVKLTENKVLLTLTTTLLPTLRLCKPLSTPPEKPTTTDITSTDQESLLLLKDVTLPLPVQKTQLIMPMQVTVLMVQHLSKPLLQLKTY